ncbi:hypothetical protein LTS18_001894, partial [Coniosporium uncinatum]
MERDTQVPGLERQKSAEPVQALPEPPAAPLPTPTEGGRRGHKYASEYDLEKVMQESAALEQKRLEEQEREAQREREALEREADIPAMFTPAEREKRRFKDTNGLRNPADALKVFEFEPPSDNFSVDEHERMVEAYRETPKKWGIIASKLAGRTYKECINHYYHTKWYGEYKIRDKKGRLKGKRAKAINGKGKASHAISAMSMAEGDDPPVTESGRPKRAAAPTFGEKEAE